MEKRKLIGERGKKPQPEGWMTLRHERRDYGFYMIGQNIIYTFVTSFMVTYMLMCGIPPVKSAAIMLVVKVWDAVNDVLFGGLMDKIKFKKKVKFLPWLRASVIFIPLFTFLMYAVPGSAGENIKLAWFAVAYVLWESFYTLCDAPIYGMVTTMTSDLNERNTIMSHSRIYSALGAGLPALLGAWLISREVGMSFTAVGGIFSAVALATMLPICIRGKERNYVATDQGQEFGLREMFRYLVSNKYLFIFFGAYLVCHCLGTSEILNLFVSYYLFGNELFSVILMVLTYLPVAILALFAPRLLKLIDKYKLFFYCNVAAAVLGILIYLTGYSNIYLFVGLNMLRGIPIGISTFLVFMFTPDCAEYGQFKSGVDARGITFSLQTFSAKLTGSVATALGMFIIGLYGWKEVVANSFEDLVALEAAQGPLQTPQAINGLWITYALVPVIGFVLSTAILYFYRLSNRDVQAMSDCNAGKITREEAIEQLTPALKKEFT